MKFSIKTTQNIYNNFKTFDLTIDTNNKILDIFEEILENKLLIFNILILFEDLDIIMDNFKNLNINNIIINIYIINIDSFF